MDEGPGLRLHEALRLGLILMTWARVGLLLPLILNERLAVESRVGWLVRELVDSLLLLKGLHELLLSLIKLSCFAELSLLLLKQEAKLHLLLLHALVHHESWVVGFKVVLLGHAVLFVDADTLWLAEAVLGLAVTTDRQLEQLRMLL